MIASNSLPSENGPEILIFRTGEPDLPKEPIQGEGMAAGVTNTEGPWVADLYQMKNPVRRVCPCAFEGVF